MSSEDLEHRIADQIERLLRLNMVKKNVLWPACLGHLLQDTIWSPTVILRWGSVLLELRPRLHTLSQKKATDQRTANKWTVKNS